MRRVLVTGASGFIGRALCAESLGRGIGVIGALRRAGGTLPPEAQFLVVGELIPDCDWLPALHTVDTVVHLAARVHVMRETASDPLTEFRLVNVDGTMNLARQAAASGVRRFVYLSSIKVNGEQTLPGQRFTEKDQTIPEDAYAVSKREAEQWLLRLASEVGMEVVIIRPPLVYGPGVKANFLTMMRWLYRGLPLPFGAVRNKRSLVALDNLVDLIITCIDHPAAANQVFLAGDGEDLSTPDLLQRLGQALGKPARLIPVPAGMLRRAASLLGKGAVAQRLLGSLQVDIAKARTILGWNPPVTVDDALQATARHFLESHGR